MVIYLSFQLIRYGNRVCVKIFDVSQNKVKLEETDGVLGKVVEPDELEKIIPCSKLKENQFANCHKTSKIFARNFKMLLWNELNAIDHFAWGFVNQRCRSGCLLEVSRDTCDTLIMMVGDEVGCSIFF